MNLSPLQVEWKGPVACWEIHWIDPETGLNFSPVQPARCAKLGKPWSLVGEGNVCHGVPYIFPRSVKYLLIFFSYMHYSIYFSQCSPFFTWFSSWFSHTFSSCSELSHGFLMNLGVSTSGGSPIASWFIMKHPIKMDDFGVPPFVESPILGMFFFMETVAGWRSSCRFVFLTTPWLDPRNPLQETSIFIIFSKN